MCTHYFPQSLLLAYKPHYWIAGVHNPTSYHDRNLFWREFEDSGLWQNRWRIGGFDVTRWAFVKLSGENITRHLNNLMLGLSEIQLINEAVTWFFHKSNHVPAGQNIGFKGLGGFLHKFQDNEKIKGTRWSRQLLHVGWNYRVLPLLLTVAPAEIWEFLLFFIQLDTQYS